MVSRRAQPGLWDAFYATHGFVPDPMLWTFMSPTYPGGWDTPQKRQYTTEFTPTVDPTKQMEAMQKLQALFYEEVPLPRTGEEFTDDIHVTKVEGIGDSTLLAFNRLFNVWFRR